MPIGVGIRTDALATRPVLFVSDGRVRATLVTRVISGAARDAGNSPVTTLRGGLVLGKITASGKLAQYDALLADGTQTAYAILLDDVRVVDDNGANQDVTMRVCISGDVNPNNMLIKGAAFVGHTNEAVARTALKAAGKNFIFADE